MPVSPSAPPPQERPSARVWLVLVWSLATALVALVASVPSYRLPWTSSLVLTARGPGLLVSEPISPFDTPYLSSAVLRIPAGTAGRLHGDLFVFRASDDLRDVGELAGRTLLRVTAAEFAGSTWKPDRPVQFAPSSAVRLAFVADATTPIVTSDLPITIGSWRTGHPVSETRWPAGEWLAASVLALASVGTLAMTYALAVRLGASRRESLLAAGLLAASTSMTVFSRHFFPYDTSLFLLLAALWIGLGIPRRWGARTSSG